VLAFIGLVLGCFGCFYAMSDASMLLMPREKLVSAVREYHDKQLGQAKPEIRELRLRIAEKQADAHWSRRNVALPLAAVELILSVLLFAGCARALRGMAWGHSAWLLAAKITIPYLIVRCAFAFVQARDLAAIYGSDPGLGPEATMRLAELSLVTLSSVFKAGLQLIYCVGSILYLRRPEIAGLFRRASDSAA
jgi:hypothetical protein